LGEESIEIVFGKRKMSGVGNGSSKLANVSPVLIHLQCNSRCIYTAGIPIKVKTRIKLQSWGYKRDGIKEKRSAVETADL
jgi:hypothetical protein